MAVTNKTLLDKPELAEELVEIAAECIRKLARCSKDTPLTKDAIYAYNYAVTGIYRILPYIAVPRANMDASIFSMTTEETDSSE